MQAGFQDNELTYIPLTPLPGEALQAVEEGLINCGFANSAIVRDYKLLSDKACIELNALAFAHPSQRGLSNYAGITIYNAANGRSDNELVKQHLSISSAPFHLIHRENAFSFWISKATTQPKKRLLIR